MGGVEQDLLMVTHPVLCFQNVRFEASLRPPDTLGDELPSSGGHAARSSIAPARLPRDRASGARFLTNKDPYCAPGPALIPRLRLPCFIPLALFPLRRPRALLSISQMGTRRCHGVLGQRVCSSLRGGEHHP